MIPLSGGHCSHLEFVMVVLILGSSQFFSNGKLSRPQNMLLTSKSKGVKMTSKQSHLSSFSKVKSKHFIHKVDFCRNFIPNIVLIRVVQIFFDQADTSYKKRRTSTVSLKEKRSNRFHDYT